MAMRIAVELLNGETLELEVRPEMTIRQVKQQIKDTQRWDDDVSRDTTVVELIVGEKKLKDDETVAELGLSDSKVSVVFRPNVARCSAQSGFGPDVDPEALVLVEIPESKTQIVADAFHGCERVLKVVIPESITDIGTSAFRGCSSLVTVSLPVSVTLLRTRLFSGCASLSKVTIGGSVTDIGHRSFEHCSSLKHVSLPHSVTSIGNGAFEGCASLSSITVPDSLVYLGDSAFKGCSLLTSLSLPDSLREIGHRAVHGCSRLTLTLPRRLMRPGLGSCKAVVAMGDD